jgi:hypothetical protein
MRFATNWISVGHARRARMEVEPANGLAGFVVFDWLRVVQNAIRVGGNPRVRNPSGDHSVVVAEWKFVFGLNERSGRIRAAKLRNREFFQRVRGRGKGSFDQRWS